MVMCDIFYPFLVVCVPAYDVISKENNWFVLRGNMDHFCHTSHILHMCECLGSLIRYFDRYFDDDNEISL